MDLTPVPGAESRFGEDGKEIVDVMTCGQCGRSWNDAAISQWTPTPSGRCPFEYEHVYPETDDHNMVVIEFSDGGQAKWGVTDSEADTIAKLVENAIGPPDTITA